MLAGLQSKKQSLQTEVLGKELSGSSRLKGQKKVARKELGMEVMEGILEKRFGMRKGLDQK